MLIENLKPKPIDERRDLIVPGNQGATLTFCAEHFVHLAQAAVRDHNAFFVALSGGSTPKAIFSLLSSPAYRDLVPWNKCYLFWSDERAALPDDPESNYHMAMDSGLREMPIPAKQIYRMQAETEIEKNAVAYEQTIKEVLKGKPFDLIMLGMGEDGHTASLFPNTEALSITDRQVVANFVPQKDCWRMTFTYPCIHRAKVIAIYVIGSSKKKILSQVLFSPSQEYPICKVGTREHKALWIADEAAASSITSFKEKNGHSFKDKIIGNK